VALASSGCTERFSKPSYEQTRYVFIVVTSFWPPVWRQLAILVHKMPNGLSAQYLVNDCQLTTTTSRQW